MLETELLAFLLADAVIAAQFGTDVYVQRKDDHGRDDYLLITEVSIREDVSVQRERGLQEVVIQFDIYCRDGLKVREIKQHLIELFSGAEHSLATIQIQLGLLQSSRSGFTAKKNDYSHSLDFKFFHA